MRASTKTLIEVFRHKRQYQYLDRKRGCWFIKRAADLYRDERARFGAAWLRAHLIAGAEWTRWRAAAEPYPLSHPIWSNAPQGDTIGLRWAIAFARRGKRSEAERELRRTIERGRDEKRKAKFRTEFYLTT